MRLPAALLALGLAILAGCGGQRDEASPADVVREWSDAVNEGDNEAAARLFARNAQVVQGDRRFVLAGRSDAVRFNSALPCSGRIVALRTRGEVATADFVLGERPAHRCDGPGEAARALFRVHDGKIVLWHQLPVPENAGTPV